MAETSMAMTRFLHGSPAEAVGLLDGADAPADRWILGAALGALGRYGAARRLLSGLTAEPTRYGSLACSTLASHYRQLGRHEEARTRDTRALAMAGADQTALFDAQLGLAADAVGVADLSAARSWLAVARTSASGWRAEVRLGWVETEIALLAGSTRAAADAAARGLAVARSAAAPRHVAKCLLFLGVSEHAAGAAAAAPLLAEASSAALAVNATPLHWVAEAVLAERADLDGRAGDARRHRSSAAATVLEIADHLDAPDRARWLARPEFHSLPL